MTIIYIKKPLNGSQRLLQKRGKSYETVKTLAEGS